MFLLHCFHTASVKVAVGITHLLVQLFYCTVGRKLFTILSTTYFSPYQNGAYLIASVVLVNMVN